jgi:bifunctional N-acetylglucosamine-1-phosphate-uridyltransferase/glucosamine-1-phosphate-acetyltransferase GlmU-like protein
MLIFFEEYNYSVYFYYENCSQKNLIFNNIPLSFNKSTINKKNMKTHYYRQDIIDICDKKHLTVEEIFEKISLKYNDAGKSSIYRNVEDMVKK